MEGNRVNEGEKEEKHVEYVVEEMVNMCLWKRGE